MVEATHESASSVGDGAAEAAGVVEGGEGAPDPDTTGVGEPGLHAEARLASATVIATATPRHPLYPLDNPYLRRLILAGPGPRRQS